MAQGYFTLQEAAHAVGMKPDELKQMAQKNQIRSFQDRGTLRFRVQDIEELARQRGLASDPNLVLGEVLAPKSGASPKSGAAPRSGVSPRSGIIPRSGTGRSGTQPGSSAHATPKVPPREPEVFDFNLEQDEGVLDEVPRSTPASGKPKRGSSTKLPTPEPGVDSDVRLISDPEDVSFNVGDDSDLRLINKDSSITFPTPATPPAKPTSRLSKLGGPARSGKLAPGSASKTPNIPVRADSGVRLVPMDSDSDVRLLGSTNDEIDLGAAGAAQAGDSNVRLEKPAPLPPESNMMLTEEINLDEELRKQEALLKQQSRQQRLKPKSEMHVPPSSPFELSEAGGDVPTVRGLVRPPQEDTSDFELAAKAKPKDDSSDFNLIPSDSPRTHSPEQVEDDFSLEVADDAINFDLSPAEVGLSSATSGMRLDAPDDAGISLESEPEPSSEFDFEVNLDAGGAPHSPLGDTAEDSEFELNLDNAGDDLDLSLEAEDSDFDLTLDDGGQLEVVDEPLQAKEGEEQDIFETDYDAPAVGEDSASEVTGDTDLESSEFDLALDDSDLGEEESASQVVPLDDESESLEIEAAEDDDASDFSDMDGAAVVEEEEEEMAGSVREVIKPQWVRPAPWGVLPVVFMLPCVFIMFLVAILGYELVLAGSGYRAPGPLTKALAQQFQLPIK